MTVKELIEKLKGFDENLEVMVSSESYLGVFCLDHAVINTETWQTKGCKTEVLNISLDD